MPKRLFVAIKIKPSTQLLHFYHELQENLQTEKIKWVSKHNLHVTLKFLGEINRQFLPEIHAGIKTAVEGLEPFEILIKGLGRFLKKKHARVIWLGIEDRGNILASTATALNKTFSSLGIEIEQKKYKPHFT